jgi:hypothetical protein
MCSTCSKSGQAGSGAELLCGDTAGWRTLLSLTRDVRWLPAFTDPRPLPAPAPAVLATLPVDARARAEGFFAPYTTNRHTQPNNAARHLALQHLLASSQPASGPD